MRDVRPLNVTGPNGLPVAMRARPSVHCMRSAGIATDLLVGFESGKMIGRGVPAAMARMIGSRKGPLSPLVPISTVGLRAETIMIRSGGVAAENPKPAARPVGQANSRLAFSLRS